MSPATVAKMATAAPIHAPLTARKTAQRAEQHQAPEGANPGAAGR
jgi:hypothetical protein